MFGGKFNHQAFANGFRSLKGHISNGYQQTKHFLGNVNQAYNTAKKIYSIAAPHIDALGGANVNRNVIKAMGGSEQVRHKVMDAHDNVAHRVNQVSKDLRKATVHIGL